MRRNDTSGFTFVEIMTALALLAVLTVIAWGKFSKSYDEALEACNPPVFAGSLPTMLVGRSGWIEGCRGRFDETVKILEPLVQKEPRFLWGWNVLLECHLCLENKDGYARTAREMARLPQKSATRSQPASFAIMAIG